jgi:predicted esterase
MSIKNDFTPNVAENLDLPLYRSLGVGRSQLARKVSGGALGAQSLLDTHNFRLLESSRLLSSISPSPGQENAVFTAKPRPKVQSSAVEYAAVALKVIFFPVTAVYYMICALCSWIAFKFGVGANEKIDGAKRNALKSLGGQEILFMTEDKVRLEGMHFANSQSVATAKTVLICSGSHKSYEEYTVPMVDALLKQGHRVMVFNYRGFGKSKGSLSEEGFCLDAEAAYQYLQSVQGRSDDQIAVLGYSMGAAPATDLAANHKIKLILDRYFSSMKDVASDVGGLLAKVIFYLGGASFDMKEKIKKVQGEIFLARGSLDRTMRPYHEKYLKSALASNPRASFVTVHSSHDHSTSVGLWFHPENGVNAEPRQQLMRFLQAGLSYPVRG